jgi:hypothetical protein
MNAKNQPRNRSGSQRRRRRPGGNNQGQGGVPKGPMMTTLGESTYEAVFDHGSDGYGVWFDGVVRDDPMYRQHWKGTGMRPIFVRLEEDRIIISKELDRELPVLISEPVETDVDGEESNTELDLDLEGDVAKATAETEVVYTPEEAAALFAQSATDAESAASDQADDDAAAEVPAKPKRKTTRRTTKAKAAEAADDSADE